MNKITKVGIVLPSLVAAQSTYEVCLEANKLAREPYDCTIFIEDLFPALMRPMCGVMSINEVANLHGIIITSTINNTRTVLNAVSNKKVVLYMWDLEWLRHNKDYLINIEILQNPNLKIACRKGHEHAIENYTNKPVLPIKFNIKELIEYVK